MGGFSSTVQQGQPSMDSSGGKGLGGEPTPNQPSTQIEDLIKQPSSGKGGQQIQGMQGASTNSATSGQPTMGAPNQYPNTVGQWDNTQIKPAQQQGKGKANKRSNVPP